MTTSAPSAAPVNALRIWTDGRDIYTEIPGKGDCPCAVFKFALCENGLWRALHLLRGHSYEYAGEPYPATKLAPAPLNPMVAAAGSICNQLGIKRK